MTTETWHVPMDLLERYATGALPPSAAWSLEQHVTACAPCRANAALVAEELHAAELQASWGAVDQRLLAGSPSLGQRALEACGVPTHLAVRLTATPALVAAWVTGAALALLAAVAAAHVLPSPFTAAPEGRLVWFLLLAPAIPAAGVAGAFGLSGDPAGELTVTMPASGASTLLARSAATIVAAVPLCGLATLLLPVSTGRVALGWLLPALAVTAVTVALSAVVSVRRAAAVAWAVWALGLLGAEVLATAPLATTTAAGQALVTVVALVATATAISVRDRLEVGR